MTPCDGSIFVYVSVAIYLILIVISTIDCYTGVIWCCDPSLDMEIRYIITVAGIVTMFAFFYCKIKSLQDQMNGVRMIL